MSYARTAVTRMTLDMSRPDLQRSETVTLGDTNRRWEVTLINGGAPFRLPPNWTAALTGIKPDGTGLLNGCSVADGKIIYDFAAGAEIATCAGSYPVQFDIWDEVGDLVASPKIYVNVLDDVRPHAELASNGQYSLISDAIAKINAMETDVDNLSDTSQAQGEDITALKKKITTAGTVTIHTTQWSHTTPHTAHMGFPSNTVQKGQAVLFMPLSDATKEAAAKSRLSVGVDKVTDGGGDFTDYVPFVQAEEDAVPTIDLDLGYIVLRTAGDLDAMVALIGVDAYGEGGGGVDETAVRAIITAMLGNVDNERQYSAANPPPYPVTSVNGKTGAVSLTIPSEAADVNADPAGTAEAKLKTHNTDNDAHEYIQQRIDALRTLIENFLDIDDESFDQLSEILRDIRANTSALELLGTNKVDKTAISTSMTDSNPEHVASMTLIVALDNALTVVEQAIEYLKTNKQTAEQVSAAINNALSGYLTSVKAAELYQPAGDYAKPDDIPTKLPNPHAITINGETYDGSEPVNIKVGSLTEDVTETGSVVTLTKIPAGDKIEVVSTFGGKAVTSRTLLQVASRNLLDFATKFGGVGTTVTKSGITATINSDHTVTVSGSNTSDAEVNFFGGGEFDDNEPGIMLRPIYMPAGSYCAGASISGIMLVVNLLDANGRYIGIAETAYNISVPFQVYNAQIRVPSGFSGEVKIPIAFWRGTETKLDDYVYNGKQYKATFPSAISEGSYNWNTGELRDTDGNLIDTLTPFDITSLGESNTFVFAYESVTVSGTKSLLPTSSGGSAVVESAFDPSAWGLPVLHLKNPNGAIINKDDYVEIDYIHGKGSGTCQIKWQGSSSLLYPKHNYTIKFDDAFEATDLFKAAELWDANDSALDDITPWGAQKKYCLKADYIDASSARNVVCAKLWGQIVKSRAGVADRLSSLPNGGAIDGFPVIVTMDGKFHGLYNFNIPKGGWMLGMGTGAQEAIVGADAWTEATAFRQTATMNGDFEIEYVPDESNTDWVLTSLNRLINAVIASDGSDLDTTIAQYMDIDSAIEYFIFVMLIGGADMIGRNYLLHTFDGVKWGFTSYDMDTVFGLSPTGRHFYNVSSSVRPDNLASFHRLYSLLKEHKADALKARYSELRASIMSEYNVARLYCEYMGDIALPVYIKEFETYSHRPSTATSNLAQILNWYSMRVKLLDEDIERL